VDSVQGKEEAEVESRGEAAVWSCKLCTYEHTGAEADRKDCAMCATPRASTKADNVHRSGAASGPIAGAQSSKSSAKKEGAGGKGGKPGQEDRNSKSGEGPVGMSQQRSLLSYLGKRT
jgi:hypothetical protein